MYEDENAPPPAAIPAFLLRTQPPAQFAVSDDGRLFITVGDSTQTLLPDDICRLDGFLNMASPQ